MCGVVLKMTIVSDILLASQGSMMLSSMPSVVFRFLPFVCRCRSTIFMASSNVFSTEKRLQERYDLKGSVIGRRTRSSGAGAANYTTVSRYRSFYIAWRCPRTKFLRSVPTQLSQGSNTKREKSIHQPRAAASHAEQRHIVH